MILRENVNVDPRVGRGHFLGVLDVKNSGGILWVYGVKNKNIYIGNTSSCKEIF